MRAMAASGSAATRPASLNSRTIYRALKVSFESDRAGTTHGELAATLRFLNEKVRQDALTQSRNGTRIAGQISKATDYILKALLGLTADRTAGTLCLVATGGYGRGALCPQSDLDLLILHRDRMNEALRDRINAFLYPLWDCGLTLGQTVATPASAVSLGRKTPETWTSFLDQRFIAGDSAIYGDFSDRLRAHLTQADQKLVDRLYKDQQARHRRGSGGDLTTEPDIKTGIGGTRDLETIAWVHHALGLPSPYGTAGSPFLDSNDLRELQRHHAFLLAIRAFLHDHRGTNDNRLSLDVQPALASLFDYQERPGIIRVERFIRHTILTMRRISWLNSRVWDQVRPQTPAPGARLHKKLSGGLRKTAAGLDFAPGPKMPDPAAMFTLLATHARQPEIPIAPAAIATLQNAATRLDKTARREGLLAEQFKILICKGEDPERDLRRLRELGLLGRYLPALEPTFGRPIFGLYRRYALDLQCFKALAMARRLAQGLEKRRHPVTTKVMQLADDPYPFYLTILFHEVVTVAKSGPAADTARMIARTCRRLGLARLQAADVGWAAANRRLMLETVERRTLADQRTIERFCAEVGTLSRLDLLSVCTVCHLDVVRRGAWTERLERRLSTLYEASREWMTGGPAALKRFHERRRRTFQRQISAHLKSWTDEERKALFNVIRDSALPIVTPKAWADLGQTIRQVETLGTGRAVQLSTPVPGQIDALVYGDDRVGLLADITAIIGHYGLTIDALEAMTTPDLKVIDIFVMHTPENHGERLPLDPDRMRSLHADLTKALAGPIKRPSPSRPRFGERKSLFTVEPAVVIDKEASETALVIECIGLDRPGLVFQITRALSEIGVGIVTAHIATYGERAIDTFYLQDAPGYKITNKRRLQSIERRLVNVLQLPAR